ncbi:hypothetical protein BCV69DRAFT_281311 [Microstroma glucosiphilum]|uniref:C2H2-type domain-containing protein n=1 Tax=Pseudomicrostroma glucosiphilum TaxID=1684307 RepID=A0A316UGL7_9BASI|nr:hypothetical protein BCV69DRAFT_281311 [Pseudomicrostroma glucosiphilum]PWN22305.1 hypothetical protein BCV69DRAFT_281311 [Pseudomicrostroma glucosiphilum]
MASSIRPPNGANNDNHSGNVNNTGAGHDFVLFDDTGPFSSGAQWSGNPYPSRPPIHDKPSFTQYRAGPGSIEAGAAGGESPFSSPASRLEDDFGGPSSVGSHGSGTLSNTTGLPNRKRQRPNGSGHGASSSTSSLSSALNPTGTPRSRSNNPSHQSPTGHHNQALPPSRRRSHPHPNSHQRSSITGLSDLAGPIEDWNLADTSPRNPPSGSFGPLLGSLSLGGDGKEELLPSLFPELQGDSGSNASQGSTTSFRNAFSPPQSRSSGVTPSSSSRSLLSDTGPVQMDPTPAQEALARQQVRQDLAGVDQRALRGPLRALAQSAMGQQQGQQQPSLQSGSGGSSEIGEGISDAEMESALRAAVDNFVAESESGRYGLNGNARAPGAGDRSASLGALQDSTSAFSGYDGSGLTQAQLSLLFPGVLSNLPAAGNANDRSFGVTPNQLQGSQQQSASQQGRTQAPRPPPGPRRRSSSFDSSFLPVSRPWFSQSPPQGQGSLQGSNAPGGIGMGQGTGWTGLPTNSFNASDLSGQYASNIAAALMASGAAQGQWPPSRRPMTRDRSGLTVSPQETFLDFKGIENTLQNGGWQGSLFSTAPQGIDQVLAGGAGGGSGSGVVPKPQLLRGDTVKPSLQQQQQQQQQLQQLGGVNDKGGPLKSDSSASSGMSVFSPVGSDATPDTDDEDEKVFSIPPSTGFPEPLNYEALAKQLQQQQQSSQQRNSNLNRSAGPSLPGRSHPQGGYGGLGAPRFLASSSSSSESEDDMPTDADSRGFPRFNGANARDFGQAPPALLQDQPPSGFSPGQGGIGSAQPPVRGRGLQGGYGYMPGSAESGLAIDPSFEGASKSHPHLPNLNTSSSTTNGAFGTAPLSAASLNAMDFSSGAQSQDEERLSPSIRSTAQVISPPHQQQQTQAQQQQQQRRQAGDAGRRATGGLTGQQQQQFGRQQVKAGYGGYPLPHAATSSPKKQRRASLAVSEGSQSSASWQSEEDDEDAEGEEDEDDDDAATADSDVSNFSDEGGAGASKKKKKQPIKKSGGRAAGQQQQQQKGGRTTAAANKARRSGTGGGGGGSGPMYGHSLSSPESQNQALGHSAGSTTAALAAAAASGGVSQHGHLTVCEYLSPLTGARCGTEFHRPYDLARHRETIHAKEEAALVRQGKLSKSQCRVLYVEVDPEKSQATQEWKCDGRSGCGSVFSRKDALQRHRRLRGH